MATPKQEKLMANIVENAKLAKPRPMGALLLDAGYSKATAIKPSVITKTNSFIELLERSGVTDKRIAKVVRDGLYAMNGKKADHHVRHNFVKTACQLKGHLKESDMGGLENINQVISSLKGLDVQVLMIIKQKLAQPEAMDVTSAS